MSRYHEKITDQSVWLTATPTRLSLSMPFFATEAGHFFAENGYLVRRESHDSFLLLYTKKGCGNVQSGTASFSLSEGHAAFLDCHSFHEYYAVSESWEFLWIHMKGNAVPAFFELLYPQELFPVTVREQTALTAYISSLQEQMRQNDMLSCISGSSLLHEILNLLIRSTLIQEQEKKSERQLDATRHVISYIRSHYAEAITLDDMLRDVPVSKYHFIRSFKRITGSTPYHYLMNFRITTAKHLLCSTGQSVAEIAENCGFSDASSFITHFRKYTGQNPLQYRKYFS